MKRLLIVLSLFIASCSHNKKAKIGFMLPNLSSARYTMDHDHFIARAEELGFEPIFTNAHDDDLKQITQAKEIINKGAKVLVVMPVNINSSAEIVRYAHSRDVKVISYCRLIGNSDLDFFIGFDAKKIGHQMAEYMIKKHPYGNYVIFNGDKGDNSAVLTNDGFQEVLNPFIKSGKIKILYSGFIESWSPQEAYLSMKKVIDLSGASVDVILSGNDGLAGGIINALDEYNLPDKALVSGLDADLDACKRISKDKQSMTVYMPIKKLARFTAEVAVNLLKNKPIQATNYNFNGLVDVPSIIYNTIPVNKQNLRSTIIVDGYHKEEEIFELK